MATIKATVLGRTSQNYLEEFAELLGETIILIWRFSIFLQKLIFSGNLSYLLAIAPLSRRGPLT